MQYIAIHWIITPVSLYVSYLQNLANTQPSFQIDTVSEIMYNVMKHTVSDDKQNSDFLSTPVIHTVYTSQPVEPRWDEVEPTWTCCLWSCRNKFASTGIPVEFPQHFLLFIPWRIYTVMETKGVQPAPVRWPCGQCLLLFSVSHTPFFLIVCTSHSLI